MARGQQYRADLLCDAALRLDIRQSVWLVFVFRDHEWTAIAQESRLCDRQPTGDGGHWDGLQLYATNPVIMAAGNQNSFANFNMYSQEGTVSNGSLGADTCWYMVANHDDQNGSYFTALTLDHFKNIYCEPEGGPHAASMPQWEWTR